MSRIGKLPIQIPENVTVEISGTHVKVTGPKGTLERDIVSRISVKIADNQVEVTRKSDEKVDRSMHGLTRSLIANMVEGVSKGYEKKLEIHGVGYRANVQGSKLVLNVGYSHPVEFPFPAGITCTVEENVITVSGIDKEVVGELSANIRGTRKPEPYKGKGIRYRGEYVPRKEGKRAASA
jgi:large subunit ribosomal protein L6